MKKINIRIPLSTANLACGFDTFGLALNKYNTYTFEESEDFVLNGFNSKYNNSNNLCLKSYIETFSILKKDIKYVSITLKQEIDNCGGLGSSANCIIAGVAAALYFIKGSINKDEVAYIASLIEGHPDNVLAEVYGGLTSAVKDGDRILHFKYEVNEKIIFTLLIPSFSLNTVEMRECLPKVVSLSDAVYNISRAANLPLALKNGNIKDLYYLMKDKLHQDYRIDKIKGAREVFSYADKLNIPASISGSGASLLLVSLNKIEASFEGFKKEELKVCEEGMYFYEED